VRSQVKLVALLIAVAFASACTAPTLTESQYKASVVNAIEPAVSTIETVRLTLAQTERHNLFLNPMDIVIGGQEDSIGAVTGTFASVQPPNAALDEVRTQVLDLLGQAEDQIAEARIQLRRGRVGEAIKSIDGIEDISKALDEIAKRYS
jgi:hypothetical protein